MAPTGGAALQPWHAAGDELTTGLLWGIHMNPPEGGSYLLQLDRQRRLNTYNLRQEINHFLDPVECHADEVD